MSGHIDSETVGRTDNDALDAHLDEMRIKKFSPATIQQAQYMLARFFVFLRARKVSLRDATPDDLEAFRLQLVDKPYAAQSVARFMEVIRRFFGWLEKTQCVFMNPARDLIVKRPYRPILFTPTEEQVKKLLSRPNVSTPLGIRDRAFMETIYSTGARLTETVTVTILDADLDRGLLHVMGKGRKQRVVPLGKQAVFWLRQYLREARPKLAGNNIDEQAFWLTREGTHARTPQTFTHMMADYCQKCCLPRISPHALRRACATHMLQRGAHPVQIQFLLGHAGLNCLGQYLRVTISDLKQMHRKSKPGN